MWVTVAKAVIAIAMWPYIPDLETTFELVAGTDRQWARACWIMFAVFVAAAVWSGVKAIHGAWLAAR